MNDNERTNENGSIDPTAAPTLPVEATNAAPASGTTPAGPTADAAPKRGLRKPVLIGVGAGLALLLVGGVSLAVGMELGDDDRDDASSAQHDPNGAPHGDDGDDRRGDRPDGDDRDDAQGSQGGAFAPADSASLITAATAALDATGGTGVSSIDVELGGYEIEVQLDGGADADVFVSTDGEVSDPYDRDADPTADAVLDLDRLDDITAAASAAAASAAGGSDGTIDSVTASDDAGVAFEVTVRYDGGREFEAALAADLSVVATDLDD
ncbi:hypothetical protein LTA6_002613 [Microbacterium sp. LTA6]|uniref:hypothetical protein n=1 Tax=Microbacterium sp. LTA6 TaxID=3129771 RepID=UPI0032478DE5